MSISKAQSDRREELLRRRLGLRRRPGRADGPRAGERAERPALSYGQRRLWFIDQAQPRQAAYTIPVAYRIRGDLDRGALERAVATVVERHESLRTTFPTWDGVPYQAIDPAGPRLRFEDLGAAARPEAEAERIVEGEALRAFDLAEGPLFRPVLLRVGVADHVLVMTVHHSVFDGWSLGVLGEELAEAYAACRAGRTPGLAPLPFQYADFAAWQHRRLTDDRRDVHLAYWRDRLAGSEAALDLPTDHHPADEPTYRGEAVEFAVPAETLARLRAIGRAHSASLFMVLLAAYHALLSRHTGATVIVVGVPVAARESTELERLIGFFAQTLAVHCDLADDPPFGALLDRVRDAVLEGIAHQELPFDQVVEHLAPARTVGRNPIVQVLFNLLPAEADAVPRLEDLEVTDFDAGHLTVRFDLELHVRESPEGATARLLYATDLFERPAMARFAAHYGNLLAAVAEDSSSTVSAIPILTSEEVDLIAQWNSASEQAY